jgi:ubiquinone/menaquinone biosynthesis C-methylase UbiE
MKINIGGVKGSQEFNGVGWKVMDIASTADFVHDLNSINRFDFDDNSIDAIYTSHTLEHILPEYQRNTFAEMYRILKPDGLIRIVVPDIEKAIQAYANKDYEFLFDSRNPGKMGSLPNDPLCYLSSWFFSYYSEEKAKRVGRKPFLGGHVMAFNASILEQYLTNAGFNNVNRLTFDDKSEIFEGCDIVRYRDNSIFIEASK